jgi:hypothetical protein
MVDTMTSPKERAAAVERWANTVVTEDLREIDTSPLRDIAKLAERRSAIEGELFEAVRRARKAHRSWSEIGAMLGVSKQAAQRKYGPGSTAA